MTHTPPVPEGNQSHYPLQEPPHAPAKPSPPAPPPGDPRVAATPRKSDSISVPTVIALAAGAGLAAVAGGLFYAFSGRAKPAKRKPGKRKTKTAKA